VNNAINEPDDESREHNKELKENDYGLWIGSKVREIIFLSLNVSLAFCGIFMKFTIDDPSDTCESLLY